MEAADPAVTSGISPVIREAAVYVFHTVVGDPSGPHTFTCEMWCSQSCPRSSKAHLHLNSKQVPRVGLLCGSDHAIAIQVFLCFLFTFVFVNMVSLIICSLWYQLPSSLPRSYSPYMWYQFQGIQ